MPWAIVRLIQRAGRVDRIGQQSDKVLCYSFLPADGVEKIINLRGRLQQRLKENREVIGTEELFFEGESSEHLLDLYNEKSGIFEREDEDVNEVDLTSEAYQVWKSATEQNPSLKRKIQNLSNCVYSSLETNSDGDQGVVALLQTGESDNILVKVDCEGDLIDHSQTNIFRSIACDADADIVTHYPNHHELVQRATKIVVEEEQNSGGQLGNSKNSRLRTYERIKDYLQNHETELNDFEAMELQRAIDEIYHNPLRDPTKKRLNSMLNSRLTSDRTLVDVVLELYSKGDLCLTQKEVESQEPRLICSLGISRDGK